MKVFQLIALAAALSFFFATDTGFAQEDEAGEEIGNRGAVEEIVVTGSRIKRRDFNSPSPITTIDRDTIAASSEATLEGLLNDMPQVTPNLGRASNNPGGGKSHINLRGVGVGRTLVMLNARRFAPSGVGNEVDINNIPQALIDRVEVITGGASTVYGSDALAGVVNFVTRDDFEGFNVEASYGITEKGDAAASDINVAWGTNFAGGSGNVTLFGGYYEREELFASDRKFTRYAWQEFWDDGTLAQGGSFGAPQGAIFFPEYDFGSGPDAVTFNADGTPRTFIDPDDRYNFQPVNYLQVPLERYTAGVLASYELSSGFELYLESTFADNSGQQELAPVPAFGFFFFTSDNPIYAPETRAMLIDGYEVAPGLAAGFLARRMVEIGPRHIDSESEYWRTVAGIRGELGGSWDIDAWATYTTSDEKQLQYNDVFFSRLEQGLTVDPVTGQCLDPSNGCQPVDLFGPGRMSPEAADFLRVPPFVNITERSQKLAAVVVTGTPFDGWAGPIDIAAGLEWRSDEVDFEADPALFTENTLGYRGDAPVSGTESVTEIYFEGIVPLYHQAGGVRHIDLELGGRYSEYDLSGGVWTYKAGLTWQMSEAVRFRGMFQHSVRAPNNFELFWEEFDEIWTVVFEASDDPCSASQDPAGNGITSKCIAQGLDPAQIGVFEATVALPVTFVQGGNPDLEPEEADTITAGLVISPMSLPNWEFAVDYFDLEMDGGIGNINAYDICFDVNNDSDIFCDKIQRGPSGDITRVEEQFQNRGLFTTSGVDTQVRFNGDMPQWLGGDRGLQLDFSLIWTHVLSLESQENPVTSSLDCRGFFGAPCKQFFGITAENRVSASIGIAGDRWRAMLNTQWIDGTDNWGKVDHQYFGGPPAMLAIPSIGSQYYADLNINYEFTDGLTAALGVSNVFDREPPQLADNGTQNNTEGEMYDLFGRSYRLSVAYRFGN
jgi:outer membrane receptor protein involved in Fe transport